MKFPQLVKPETKKAIKSTWTTTKILAKKHAPLALVITGGVGLVATAVLSYKSAKKVDCTLEKYEAKREAGEEVNKTEMAVDLAKDVAAPVLVGVTSIACITLSYAIQNNRLKALTAALAVATEEHSRYRLRAKELLDEVTFKKLDAPTETKMVETEDGEKEVAVAKEGDFYGKWFQFSSEYLKDDPAYNEQFIRSVIELAEKKIASGGVLMYNELMDMLGFDNISNSLPFGWTDTDMFYIEYDEHETWNEEQQWLEPQLYIRWKTPRNLYATTNLKSFRKKPKVVN